jgi:6-phosphogluconolactonase
VYKRCSLVFPSSFPRGCRPTGKLAIFLATSTSGLGWGRGADPLSDPATLAGGGTPQDMYRQRPPANTPKPLSAFSLPPRFDLVLLGMGPDGHTASIFPGQAAVASAERLVAVVTNAPKPPPTRLTLTYKVINQAANIMFLVSGGDKAAAVAQLLTGERDRNQWPAQGVQPEHGRLLWLLDQAAAQGIS